MEQAVNNFTRTNKHLIHLWGKPWDEYCRDEQVNPGKVILSTAQTDLMAGIVLTQPQDGEPFVGAELRAGSRVLWSIMDSQMRQTAVPISDQRMGAEGEYLVLKTAMYALISEQPAPLVDNGQ